MKYYENLGNGEENIHNYTDLAKYQAMNLHI